MESERFKTLLSLSVIPQVVDLIMRDRGLGYMDAMETFYRSKTFDVVSNQFTGAWHLSPLVIYDVYCREEREGIVDFPE